MRHTEYHERMVSCRDGPKLEMFNSIRTDRCGNRTAMVTSSSSIVRSAASESAATAAHVIAGKLDGCSGNVENDFSTASIWHLTERSLPVTSLRDLHRSQRWSTMSTTASMMAQRGRTAMSDILSTDDCECARIPSFISHRGSVSQNGFWNLPLLLRTSRRGC